MSASGNYDKTNAVAISTDNASQYSYHTVVLLNTGEVMACGSNLNGRLGNGLTSGSNTLVSMEAIAPYDKTNAIAISAGNTNGMWE